MLSSGAIAALTVIFCISRALKFLSDKKKVCDLPGLRSPFNPANPAGALLPTSWINPGLSWQWLWRNTVYERFGMENISSIGLLLGDPVIYTSSMKVARQALTTRGQFWRPPDTTAIVALWGENLFTANGAEWRRHRRIAAPAFSTAMYKLVCQESCSVFDDMVRGEAWNDQDTIILPAVNHLTAKFTLHVISHCGFGNMIPWEMGAGDGPSAGIDFGEALSVVSQSSILRILTPRWMYKLPISRLHKVDAAYKSLDTFMFSLIRDRKAELLENKKVQEDAHHDLFSLMVKASEDEGKSGMSDSELASNTFLMLFAGHDTSARVLDAALGLLAIHPQVQEDVFAEVKAALGDRKDISLDDVALLKKTECAFVEAARLFPPGHLLIREAAEDVILETDDMHVHGGKLAIQKGVRVYVDVVGIHYNARYFPEPETYRPERWYEAHENDLSMFSFGIRACIGRRFALVEAVCFLAKLLRTWRVEPVLNNGESYEQWRKRILTVEVFMTLGVGKVPIRLVRRV